MKKRFISKKKNKKIISKLLLFNLGFLIFFLIFLKYCQKSIIKRITKEEYIKYIINDSFGSVKDSKNEISSIRNLLKYSFGIDKINSEIVNNEVKEDNEVKNNDLPIVYIYNSHQGEEYKNTYLNSFNIKNTVLTASYILNEYLSLLGINSIVEENSVIDILRVNGWKYNSSYKASRILMEDSKKKQPSLNYFIDLHRDSSPYNVTTITINNKQYARFMFVIGLENPNYEKNLNFANILNDQIKIKYPGLSRGIIKKEGKGVNGKYNQDFSPNTILIELGGQYNTIEEVNNTLKIISKELASYIKGEK